MRQAWIVILFFLSPGSRLLAQASLDNLAIEVRGTSRAFVYTNKQDAYYYGETNSPNTTGWQGFNVFGHEFLDDYVLFVDGKQLDRSKASTTVYPDYLKRVYSNGVVEELHPADSIPLFAVVVTSGKPVTLEIVPLMSDGSRPEDFIVGHREHALVLARRTHQMRTAAENYPVWLGVGGYSFGANHASRMVGADFAPFSLTFAEAKTHVIAFAVADEAPHADSLIQRYCLNEAKYAGERRRRMEQLLNDSWVETTDKRFNKALAWAKLSLDALMMNQVTRGIFAGLPWFNNYWGRDTFISLPGAALVTGRFSDARAILRSFAAYQQIDSSSTDYGRIPNIVTTTDKAYNTADGTPRFVMMSKEYVERSGDSTFMLEVYPTVIRSIEGTLKYHTDSLGFLTHGDAETWTDAVGPDGPWSPRGNRANDIQALWSGQLEAGVWFATQLGDAISAREWYEKLQTLKNNFPLYFIKNGAVADHLMKDGSRDLHLRPNQIFVGDFLDENERAHVLRTVINNLTYPYGVASLSQEDDNFHPYHQYEPYYPKDAAYHNGTVWTWLQGRVISELCRFGKEDLAWKLTTNTVHQILDRGSIGTQSELIDAVPRAGETEPRLSGTVSQAWNLAEFIRNFYDDYLGARVNRYDHSLTLSPTLPSSLGAVKARVNMEGRPFAIEVDSRAKNPTITIQAPALKRTGHGMVILRSETGQLATITCDLKSNALVKISMKNTSAVVSSNGKQSPFKVSLMPLPTFGGLQRLAFVTPHIKPGLAALRGPDYPLLQHSRIKATNPKARTIIDASDPEGDDAGPGTYTYPSHPFFKPGILDITRFTLGIDDSNAYFTLKFRVLANPGWHPEYGFQLTYAAIAIDEDGVIGSGLRLVPQNSNYFLDERHGYEKLILIGGGVRLQDAGGRILAAYIPVAADVTDPLGNTATSTISFALPFSSLGKPDSNWTFTILVGGQDDHGGSGLGEFRTVNRDAGEWSGGGRTSPNDSNVYDVLQASVKGSSGK